ncbi:MAG: methyltransferase domain-containing protein [Paracoccaceae bacterium]
MSTERRRCGGDRGPVCVDLNLLKDDELLPEDRFDLVILQEVIGHLPVPPYVPLSRIRSRLKPEGRLFLTTPNASRLRNVLYLLSGREVLDHFRFPEGEEALGVQQEYTLRQMVWHFEKAGFVVTFGAHYNCGWRGRSRLAAAAHLFLRPLTGIAHLKSGLMITEAKSVQADFLRCWPACRWRPDARA